MTLQMINVPQTIKPLRHNFRQRKDTPEQRGKNTTHDKPRNELNRNMKKIDQICFIPQKLVLAKMEQSKHKEII